MKYETLINSASIHKDWSARNISDWENVRKKGMLPFVLTLGVMKWGGFMLAVFTLKDFIIGGREILSIDYLIEIFIWFCAGFFFGFVIWNFTNLSYLNATEKLDN